MAVSEVCKDNVGCTKNEFFFFPNIQVFWTQTQSSDTNWVIHEKIKSAFCKLDLSHLNGLIQFWAPDDGKRLLSTTDQPFSLEHLHSCFHKYRLCSTTYQYSIDVNNVELEEVITGGAAASAFQNHLPLVVYFKAHQGRSNSPLMTSALKYKLTCLFLLVFYPPHSCVGVVECSVIMGFGLLVIFNKLKTALESVGLTTFHAQESRSHSFKNICGLKITTDEIEKALEIVCESHHLTLAQVWISCLDDTQTKPKFAVKLIGYYDDTIDDNLSSVRYYFDTCDMLPLILGEGLSGKTLLTYEPRFCRDINELTDKGLFALLPANTQCGCLVICLRSLVTGDVDYAFEFLWTQNRNFFILLESLVLTLKRCLPSFKLASGAELGDELRVIDVDNSTGSGIGFLKILEVNRLSQLPKSLEERRRLMVDDCMSSSAVKSKMNPIPLPQEELEHRFMNQDTRNLKLSASKRTRDDSANSELLAPDFAKRRLSDVCETQIESSHEENDAYQKDAASSTFLKIYSSVCNRFLENTMHSASNSNSNSSVRYPVDVELIIRAEYGDEGTLSYLPISSTYADIMKNFDEAYNLVPGSYALHY